jgi:hypothetical protein
LPKDSQRNGKSSGWHLLGPEFDFQWEQISGHGLKKIPSSLHIPKHMSRPGPAAVTVHSAILTLTWDYVALV